MLRNGLPAILAAVIAASPSNPAQGANDDTLLAANLKKAATAVTSFQATLTGLPQTTAHFTFVRPDRMSNVVTVGSKTLELTVIGTTMYYRSSAAAWKASSNAATRDAAKQLVDSLVSNTTYRSLPERQESGVVVGAFSASIPASKAAPLLGGVMGPSAAQSAPPIMETCTYDKTTFLLHICTMQLPNLPAPITMTYSQWNDPSNVVDVPAGAPAAPVTPAAPSPRAAPTSAASPPDSE